MEEAARELSSAYRVHEPSRRVSVPPSTGHLISAPQFLDLTALRGRSEGRPSGHRLQAEPRCRQETPGWKRERRREEGDGERGAARRPRCLPGCREAAKPVSGDAAALPSLGSARVGSGAARESQLCTTRRPLPSPSHWLEYYFLLLLFLSPPFGFFFFPPPFLTHWLFHC